MKRILLGGCMSMFLGCLELGQPSGQLGQEWRYVWILEQPYADDSSSMKCPDETASVRYFRTLAEGGSCTSCDCSFTGAVCSSPGVGCNTGSPNTCTMNELGKYNTAKCAYISPTSSVDAGCQLTSPSTLVSPGQCQGTPSNVIGPVWKNMVLSCAAESDTCDNESCFAPPTGAFESAQLCIMQQGTTDCPDDWSNQILTVYSGANDERTCGTCGCDTSSITCSGGAITLFDEQNCDPLSAMTTLSNLNECKPIVGYFGPGGASILPILGTPSPGTCTPASLTGAATPTGPQTICCK